MFCQQCVTHRVIKDVGHTVPLVDEELGVVFQHKKLDHGVVNQCRYWKQL